MQVPVQVGGHRNFSVVGSDDFNEVIHSFT